MPITQQLTVTAANRPGALARIAQALAAKRINITGLDASGPHRQIRLLVGNPEKARRVLREAGFRARLDPVLAVNLPDRPGSLARAAGKLAAKKININYSYATAARGGKRATVIFGLANPRRAARLV